MPLLVDKINMSYSLPGDKQLKNLDDEFLVFRCTDNGFERRVVEEVCVDPGTYSGLFVCHIAAFVSVEHAASFTAKNARPRCRNRTAIIMETIRSFSKEKFPDGEIFLFLKRFYLS